MSRPVHTVRAADPVERAAALLAGYAVTAVPVLDPLGRMVGVVSEGDLLRHRVPAGPTPRVWRAAEGAAADRPTVVGEVMSTPVVTMPPDADVADVAAAMLRHDVRSVPIVDEGELVGIVSRRDILRAMVRTDAALSAEIQHRLDEYAGDGRWTVTVDHAEATVTGRFDDEVHRQIAVVLARTVPGVYDARAVPA